MPIEWADWRGQSNGGHIIGDNYRSFPRFRLIELARKYPELIDAKMTRFAEGHCTDECDKKQIIKEYDIHGPWASQNDVLQYKYLLDVDGNTFSGRFLALLRSGSLVFKVQDVSKPTPHKSIKTFSSQRRSRNILMTGSGHTNITSRSSQTSRTWSKKSTGQWLTKRQRAGSKKQASCSRSA